MLKAKYDDEDLLWLLRFTMALVLFLLSISLKLKTCLKIQLENSLSMWLISKTKKYEFKRKKLRHTHVVCTFMENIIIEPKFFEACLRSSPTTLSSSSHWDSVFPTHNNLLQLTLSNYRTENCVDNQAFKNGYFSSLVSGDWKMAKVGNTVKIHSFRKDVLEQVDNFSVNPKKKKRRRRILKERNCFSILLIFGEVFSIQDRASLV